MQNRQERPMALASSPWESQKDRTSLVRISRCPLTVSVHFGLKALFSTGSSSRDERNPNPFQLGGEAQKVQVRGSMCVLAVEQIAHFMGF